MKHTTYVLINTQLFYLNLIFRSVLNTLWKKPLISNNFFFILKFINVIIIFTAEIDVSSLLQ